MANDGWRQRVLRTAALFNFGAALLFAFPTSLGSIVGLPAAPPLYALLTALFVALFGSTYAWLSRQPQLDRALVALAAIGKGSAFLLFLLLWSAGQISSLILVAGAGDLAFAAIFASWLREREV